MKQAFVKLLSLVLCLAMVLSMMPLTALTAAADEITDSQSVAESTEPAETETGATDPAEAETEAEEVPTEAEEEPTEVEEEPTEEEESAEAETEAVEPTETEPESTEVSETTEEDEVVIDVVDVAGLLDAFASANLSVATAKNATLAPGVTQDSYILYNNKGEQVKMFVTTADMSVDTVSLFASYKDMDPTNYGMSKLTEQVKSFNEKAAAGDEYYQGTVVAGINASYYNMINGKPTGTFVMNGIDVTNESEGNSYGYFAVMKDGTVKIGNKGDYSSDKGNIQEAIGIYTMLIVDGKICSGLDTSKYYPRQTIGITADGDVILMTADGNQAPASVGLTVLEQAQVMLDLGCVWAGHLDGGGSCTYAAKAEGSNEFAIVNSPSDGSERSVSNGFIIVSTAVADGKFKSAALTAEHEYVTPNSVVNVSATGVDQAGGPAEIPADVSWQLADSSFGTIENGVFTSTGKTGEVVIQMVYDGKVVGETTVNVVIPDALKFSSAEITVPYGKSVELDLTATYGIKDVAIKTADFTFALSEQIGTIDGFTFTAAEVSEVNTADITATFVHDEELSATTKITLGKGSEVVYDFEDGTNQCVVIDETPGTKYNYVWPETQNEVVTAQTGKVHSGNYALGSLVNYGNSLESGYMKTSVYATETRVFENATKVGIWVYISDECVGLWARWTLRSVTGYNADGTPIFANSTINGNSMDTTAGGTGVVYSFDEPGWHYLWVDTSAYSAVGWAANAAMMQFYISDRDGSAYNYTAAANSNIPSQFYFYLDDLTVDYSSAVDDREAPVVSNLTYAAEGMPDAAALNNQTVTTGQLTFAANIADYVKNNASGIDASTVKAYIDGVEVSCSYVNGIASVSADLTNGKHTIKFSASDKMGNYGCEYGYITVNAAETRSTVKLVPHDPAATRIKLSSIYEMDLVATAIEEVQSVQVVIDLDNNSIWQLDHMEPAKGFEATYEVEKTENIATITITRTGENTQTGEAVLATLPVRVWTLKTGYVYPNGTKQGQQAFTLAQFKASLGEFWRMSVIAEVDKGVLTRVDNTSDSFTGERVFCDTEMWANKANMTATADGLAYFNAWNGGHVHSAAAIEDLDATCTENGYTGRTFCEGCNSVVEWGTTSAATGHSYDFIDGVLKCTCGELYNGVYTDGKTYFDGVVAADGWNGDAYYRDGMKLTGLQEIDGYYYDFGTEGVCEGKAKADGFYYNEAAESYMYMMAGTPAKGDRAIDLVPHFFDENGYAFHGEKTILGYVCTFTEKGVFESAEDASVLEAGSIGTNLEYVLLNDGTLRIDGEGDMCDYTVSGIYGPWFYQNMSNVKKVEIGANVTRIGEYAFNRSEYINTVTIAEGSKLESIGIYAFRACHRLATINIPASVEKIDNYAFFKCGALKNVTIEDGGNLKYIGREAFTETHYLEKIFIPASVTTIGDRLFIRGNADVTMQVVENSTAYFYAIDNGINYELVDGEVPPIGSGTFGEGMEWTLIWDGTLTVSGEGAMPNFASQSEQPWASVRDQVKKIVIGKDITAIGNYAFAYCEDTEEIVFEEGSKLERIGVLAFRTARKVTKVTLPETVTYLATYAFGTCTNLVDVFIPQGMGYMHDKAFVESTKVVLNVAATSYAEEYAKANNIAHTVRDYVYDAVAEGKCGDNATWAFYDNGELIISGSGAIPNYASQKDQPWANIRHLVKKIVIGKDITAIGNYAFAYCEYTEEIVFEEGSVLERIGVLAFRTARGVTEITLPETVTYLATYAFGTCTNLEKVYIPQGMGYMHPKAFVESTKVVLNVAKTSYAEEFAKENNIAHTVREYVYVPVAEGTCGDNATWAFYDNGELVISGSGAIPNYASHKDQPWAGIRHLVKKIVIGKDITAIGNYAFAYCEYTEEIVFEEGSVLERIGVLAFRTARKLTEVTLPETVTYLATYAFGTCTNLEKVYIPQGMAYMHNKAFVESTKVVLNVAKTSYAEEFAKENNISYTTRDYVYEAVAEGTCGDNATWAFYDNGELIISGSGSISNYASHKEQPWASIRHLVKKIVIGKDITAIGNYAFAYCEYAEEIVFEEGSVLERIGVLAFRTARKLTEVTLPETVTYLGSYAFGTCVNLEKVYIPEGVTFMHPKAFVESTKVVLDVAAGSYAEQFAKDNGIAFATR